MKYLGLLMGLTLVGCSQVEPLEPPTTQTNGVTINLVAKVEGCRVYRIRGVGHPVFTTICGPETVTTTVIKPRNCGKTCTEDVPMMDVTSRRGL
jgi:hypothetical protein